MKPLYATITDIPSGKSLAAVRAEPRMVREAIRQALDDENLVQVSECALRMKADTFQPGLMFEVDGKQFFFPVSNKWFKRAKSEYNAAEAVIRALKNRDRT